MNIAEIVFFTRFPGTSCGVSSLLPFSFSRYTFSMVSVIIPSFRTPEEKLRTCLASAAGQTFPDLEILVIDDNEERADQKLCEKTVKSFQKDKTLLHGRGIRYICHGRNRGLVTARRTGVESSRGEYVTMLDSDDEFKSPDAVSTAYEASEHGRYDIVQFCAEPHRDGAYILESNKDAYRLIEHPAQGVLNAAPDAFAETFLTSRLYCLFLWAKLIRRETFLDALDGVPEMNCFMAEDTLFSYFIARTASSYIGIPDVQYVYNLGAGISTSADTIDSLDRWKKLCTPADVFTAIMYDIQQRPFPEGNRVPEYMKKVLFHFVRRNILLLDRVSPELRDDAELILKETWGEELIAKARATMQEPRA